jgi:uncharacterized protein (UPF0335 family)
LPHNNPKASVAKPKNPSNRWIIPRR